MRRGGKIVKRVEEAKGKFSKRSPVERSEGISDFLARLPGSWELQRAEFYYRNDRPDGIGMVAGPFPSDVTALLMKPDLRPTWRCLRRLGELKATKEPASQERFVELFRLVLALEARGEVRSGEYNGVQLIFFDRDTDALVVVRGDDLFDLSALEDAFGRAMELRSLSELPHTPKGPVS